MFNLAFYLARGTGFDAPDPAAANIWYEKAAELGTANAMLNLGFHLAKGTGFDAPDPEAAYAWFEKAARLGSAGAVLKLGILHFAKRHRLRHP